MTLHPTRYAELIEQKMETLRTNVFLVNSGWSGGPYGERKRMSIKTTRSCIDAILNGSIHDAEFREDPIFGWKISVRLPGVEGGVLEPRSTWKDPVCTMERKLASMYIKNFKKYEGKGDVDYTQYGPKAE
jgi:phosphoenolpyruvate carboxykinase (ATP)